MHNSSKANLARSRSESSLHSRSLTSPSSKPFIDPFKLISTHLTKTPALKPACHRSNAVEKSFITFLPSEQISITKVPLLQKKPQPSVFAFAKPCKVFNPINPSFSAKSTDRKTFTFVNQCLRPIIREKKECKTVVKNAFKVPSLRKKMARRVNSLLFKDKHKGSKSALDFSFADPD
jgi:hypothetical protein